MDDDKYLFLAMVLKILAVVSLILGVIGSFYLGKYTGRVYTTYLGRVKQDYNFWAMLVGMISTAIAFFNMVAFAEILERSVLCDTNLRDHHNQISNLVEKNNKLLEEYIELKKESK